MTEVLVELESPDEPLGMRWTQQEGTLLISDVAPGGAAARAGVEPKSVLSMVDGEPCATAEQFIAAVQAAKAQGRTGLTLTLGKHPRGFVRRESGCSSDAPRCRELHNLSGYSHGLGVRLDWHRVADSAARYQLAVAQHPAEPGSGIPDPLDGPASPVLRKLRGKRPRRKQLGQGDPEDEDEIRYMRVSRIVEQGGMEQSHLNRMGGLMENTTLPLGVRSASPPAYSALTEAGVREEVSIGSGGTKGSSRNSLTQ
eukprot:TRINITY_DN51508_c0_g1_i1.p1 TRINITY_DN51508_c0_g1~~TRINITY_DN51508_c0_g1_i1.p1  ORF type:complete len:255 (+),score=60.16 TRINITY_DN51508_c0_g1_i1:81-845(+)